MRTAARILEPRHLSRFHCIGADCEDTCCDGWAVPVDKATYEKLRDCASPPWSVPLETLIAIRPADRTDRDYARIQLAGSACPILSEGLCSIHKHLGEDHLPVTCAIFPRVSNLVDQALEISLDLSCPEAARIALLDPAPMYFDERPMDGRDYRSLPAGDVDTAAETIPDKSYRHFSAARAFSMRLLQNRMLPLWQRVLILGFFCDKLQEMAAGPDEPHIPEMIQAYDQAVSAGSFNPTLDQLSADIPLRLELIVEFILARITSDFTNLRFRETYRQFMDGLQWTADTSMQQLGSHYAAIHAQYWQPFLAAHGHMLEHYLVNYVHRGLFPFGPQKSTYTLGSQHIQRSMHDEFMLLVVHYAIVETLLVGVSGVYKENLTPEHVIRVVYTSARTFEHSVPFADRVLEALAEKRLNNIPGAAVLLKT